MKENASGTRGTLDYLYWSASTTSVEIESLEMGVMHPQRSTSVCFYFFIRLINAKLLRLKFCYVRIIQG